MHTVLDLKTNRPIAEDNQPLEERLSESCPRSFLIHDHRTELLDNDVSTKPSIENERDTNLMITNKNYLLATQNKRDHTF